MCRDDQDHRTHKRGNSNLGPSDLRAGHFSPDGDQNMPPLNTPLCLQNRSELKVTGKQQPGRNLPHPLLPKGRQAFFSLKVFPPSPLRSRKTLPGREQGEWCRGVSASTHTTRKPRTFHLCPSIYLPTICCPRNPSLLSPFLLSSPQYMALH